VNQLATDAIAPAQDESNYFTHVFAWMAAGLAVTGGVAAVVYSSGTALRVRGKQPVRDGCDVSGLLLPEGRDVLGHLAGLQQLKKYEPPPDADYVVVEKDAFTGALAVYLHFVNLFLYLLRLLVKRR
jgi:FtsH-binding integral membrane protein